MNLIMHLNQKNMKQKITDFKVGDTVRVHQKIVEGNKERIQIFEGVVMKTRAGKNINGTVTVRKISEGVGVERTYLVHSPKVVKIEVTRRGKVRRANLSYLRNLRGKKARLKEKQFDSLIVNVADEDKTEEAKTSSEDKKGKEPKNENDKDSKTDDALNDENADVTELNSADEEDEEKLKEISTEKLAEKEEKASEKVHEVEEENTPEDESNLPESETEEGLDKAEDEDTRNQENSK